MTLDDLKKLAVRSTLASTPEHRDWYDAKWLNDPSEKGIPISESDAEFIAEMTPYRVLALLARIEELSTNLRAAARLLPDDVDPRGLQADAFIAIADRETVLL